MVYKAIGEFWTGYNDFSHMDGVMVLINRAMDTSNRNEFVLNGFNQIANNCLIICAKNKKYYGNDLKESIIIFNYFYNENIDESNKKLVKEYCSKAFNKYKNDLNKLVDSSSDYDPPYIAIENLYHLACITEELEIQEFYYAHAQRHISLNDKKTYINTLKTNFNKVKGDLENKGIDTNSIKLNCKESSFSSDGCFVATAAFGDYNHPIVLDLRKFRDESLSGTKLGDIFIKNYYKYSPYLAKFISNSLVLKLLTVYLVLKPIHIMIKKGDR